MPNKDTWKCYKWNNVTHIIIYHENMFFRLQKIMPMMFWSTEKIMCNINIYVTNNQNMIWEEEYRSYLCRWNIFNRALLRHYRQSQWLPHVWLLLHKKSVVSKLITNQNSSPRPLFFCAWRKWVCILLSFRIQSEETSKTYSDDLPAVDWLYGTSDQMSLFLFRLSIIGITSIQPKLLQIEKWLYWLENNDVFYH